ncbi:NAD(P)/FAD-dependent oxidoreductase [Aquabacterium sp. J223]|uniref:NAD(P)/FAD-dependent oxidoreductase n=1 Tax=Aquabacterium sp. J223 TaxID=2898431 RepID=UPI0021AD8E64|nr:NAD(P)/FAD-dependent oxidoreductase [Aquabacterium sp. J223]UUX94702.1 NAD(P)/FAD-dependent oxidoreductase [Aquabacterium sp. J223]
MQDTDLIVVGGGLAGLTAAADAGRAGLRCTAFAGPVPGGLLLSIESVEGLPEHPDGIPGYDLCPMAQEAAMDAGVHFVDEEAEALEPTAGGWVVRSAGAAWQARAVILAPGSRLRTLGVPGEAELAGQGVSHCASCDGPLLRGKPVAVVGGGDAACQEALTLAQHASAVHLLVRRDRLTARDAWQQRVQAQPKITVHTGACVEAIEGGGAVEAVRLADGRRLPVHGVFVYAGLLPNTDWLRGVVELDADGRILTDAGWRTASPGVFAAGSARAGQGGQAADAVADAAGAVLAAKNHLG